MKRSVWVGGSVVAAVVLVAGGWFAATQLQSPAQRAAAASPPPPQAITFEVQRGELAHRVTARAAIAPSKQVATKLTLPDGMAVVTSVAVKRGQSVAPGAQLLSVNDRPVFALPGAFPLFRDITYQDQGSDVRQLQQGLQAAGYPIPGWEIGTFGAATRDAIDAMYRRAGFKPPRTSAGEPPPEASSESAGGAGAKESGSGAPPAVVKAGVPVMVMSEVVIVRKLPLRIQSLPSVGTTLSGGNARLEFGSEQLRAEAALPVAMASSVKKGLAVRLSEGDEEVTATVVAVAIPDEADAAGGEEDSGAGVVPEGGGDATVTFAPAKGKKLPNGWAGSDVLAEITIQEIAQDALLVPSRAVTIDATGAASVLVRQDDGTFRTVPVSEIGSYAGTSAIEPAEGESLAEGDLVRIDVPQ